MIPNVFEGTVNRSDPQSLAALEPHAGLADQSRKGGTTGQNRQVFRANAPSIAMNKDPPNCIVRHRWRTDCPRYRVYQANSNQARILEDHASIDSRAPSANFNEYAVESQDRPTLAMPKGHNFQAPCGLTCGWGLHGLDIARAHAWDRWPACGETPAGAAFRL